MVDKIKAIAELIYKNAGVKDKEIEKKLAPVNDNNEALDVVYDALTKYYAKGK